MTVGQFGDPDPLAGPERSAGPVGNPEVDAVLAQLPELHLLTPAELVERYGEIHRSLQQILRTIDAA